MTYQQAKNRMDSMDIGLVVVPDAGIQDTMNAFIYRQNPERFKR
jgi:hypothetical protein